jgi:hypothetical protein
VRLIRVDGESFQHDLVMERAGTRQRQLLNNPDVREAVTELLASVVCFFRDVEGVKRRQGQSLGRNTSPMISTVLLHTSRFNSLRITTEKLQKEASTWNKLRWVFSGKEKSEKLRQELTRFIDKLHELRPNAGIMTR